ncbi:hypothetical protein NEHOM01_0529 [Nematocida homosporus]|uniref:uncharacterized protein n=1 Tax=Nematocida homosporus TaxID=1912981 RepID=UPI00221F5D06|nr:uncharacterized protein NEHOM01_0529 [Nematocida homosporus]KAI5184978.1 hypothetical protein NEHOM01_0529 [Nematocida homosporus]
MNWSQQLKEVVITIPTLPNTSSGVKVSLINKHLKVTQQNQTLLDKTIANPILEDEMCWTVDNDEIEIVLYRDSVMNWDILFEGDKPLSSEELPPATITNLSQLDDETRQKVQKMMHENQK